jgi:CMP-N-acetylneuraminic acid synthetase
MNNVTAVIPVKKNSSRLPGKNIKIFGSENLLSRKIRQVKESNISTRIIVSSDSEEMLDIAKTHGAEAIMRPADLADESRPLSDFFDYICTLIPGGHLAWCCATSPFFDEKLMLAAKKEYFNGISKGFDSLITVTHFNHYLLDVNGPLNYELGCAHKNSQELSGIDLFTNGILFAPIEKVKEWRYNYGSNPLRFYVNQKESIDIDTELDYLCALSWLGSAK